MIKTPAELLMTGSKDPAFCASMKKPASKQSKTGFQMRNIQTD